ncbi:MAG: lipopolysaccharide heptosyltransferase II [Candidatus Omnitrophica bacterium]|nr:lipopolysaccharide heptosyltransferase II [Candidatus Omnitrophota bacterium]
MKEVKRILIFNVNWLGDVLFSTATIRNVRRNFPDGFIACIIPSRCYPVLKDNPYLDEIIIFDEKDRHRSLISKLQFIRQLRQKHFDLSLLLHGSFTRALICFLAGIPKRIGYATKGRSILLTKKIIPPDRDSLHRIDYYLGVAEKAGFRAEDRYLDFFISQEDTDFIEGLLLKEGLNSNKDILVGINAGGNWLPKRWPLQYWAELADKLIGEKGAKVIITGSFTDLSLAKAIANSMKLKPVILCGKLNLKQSAALFKKLDLFISADTGPLHIANAVGTKKIIAIFGPTDLEVTGPYPLKNVTILRKDVGCKIPCYVVDCKDSRCMKAVTPLEAFEASAKILKDNLKAK